MAEEEKLKKCYVGFKVVGKYIYEVVKYRGAPIFLCYDAEHKEFSLLESIEVCHENLVPVEQSMIPYDLPVLDEHTLKQLKDGEYKITTDEIFSLIYDQYDAFLDLEDDYKALMTASTMETYQQHKNATVGYVFVEGVFGSGKSQVGVLAGKLSYRAMICAGAHAANVYRFVGYDVENEGQQTLIEDETNYQNLTPELEDKFRMYRVGYKRGMVIPREEGAGGKDAIQRYYRTFCMKFFIGYNRPNDNAFNSRCSTVPMVEGDPMIDEIIPSRDDPKFSAIKLKAMIWRMMTYFDPLPDTSFGLKGRMKEIWKPKILAVFGTKFESWITHLAMKDVKVKFEEKHSQLEVYVLQSVLDFGTLLFWRSIPFKRIWLRTMRDMGVAGMEVERSDCYSIDVPLLNRVVSKKEMGQLLNNVLRGKYSLETDKSTNQPERVWTFEKDVIERLAKGYQLQPRKDFVPI